MCQHKNLSPSLLLPVLPSLNPSLLLPLIRSSPSSSLSLLPSSPLLLPPLSFLLQLQRLFWFNLKFLASQVQNLEKHKIGFFAASACFPLSTWKIMELSLKNLAYSKILEGRKGLFGMKQNDK